MMLYFKPQFSKESGETWQGYDVVDIKSGNGIHRDWMAMETKIYTDFNPEFNSEIGLQPTRRVRTTTQKYLGLTDAVASGNIHMLDVLVRHLFYLDEKDFPKTPVR